MAKKPTAKLKLPDDFLGTVQAFLNTAPPTKPAPKRKGKKTPNALPKVTK